MRTVVNEFDKYYVHFIKQLIENNCILNLDKQSIELLSVEKLKTDILLLLIFMRYNTNVFDELEYYFKRLAWYVSAAKVVDENIRYIAQRFHKDINIAGAEFRRINLTGYNFANSKMSRVKFIQDKVHDTIFENNEFEDVVFYLCDMAIKIVKPRGNIVIDSCKCNGAIIIEDPREVTVKVVNSNIKQLHILSKQQNKGIDELIIERCYLNDIIIKKTKITELYIGHSSFPKIKLDKASCNITIEYPMIKRKRYYDACPKCTIKCEIRAYWNEHNN